MEADTYLYPSESEKGEAQGVWSHDTKMGTGSGQVKDQPVPDFKANTTVPCAKPEHLHNGHLFLNL